MRNKLSLGLLFSLISLFLIIGSTLADTPVSGIITGNTTWTLANSPYIVTGNTLVENGVTLTIEAGVMVKFDTGLSLRVDGELIARGTSGNLITFTSSSATPQPGDWASITFTDSATDAVYDVDGNYVSGSILEYVVAEYGGYGDVPTISIVNSQAFINQSTIKNNASTGLYVENGDARISNSTIENNASTGLYVKNGDTTISNSTVNNNASTGLYVKNGDTRISNSTVSDNNGMGIQVIVTTHIINIQNSVITGNSAAGIYLEYGENDNIDIQDSTITGNSTGIFLYDTGWSSSKGPRIKNCEINDNTSYGIHASVFMGGYPYVDIQDSTITNNSSDGLYFSGTQGGLGGGSGLANNNIISDNAGSGVNGGGNLTLSHNLIKENSNWGVKNIGLLNHNVIISNRNGGISGTVGNVTNNVIAHNFGLAFSAQVQDLSGNSVISNTSPSSTADLNFSSNKTFENNTIAFNYTLVPSDTSTIYLRGSNPVLNNNNFIGNTATYTIINDISSLSTVDITNNWWGTTNDAQIQDLIYDWVEDSTLDVADYSPFLTTRDTTAPIAPPSGFAVTASGEVSITVGWDASPESDHTGYKVYWSTSGHFSYENVVDVGNVTTYTITGLTPGITYYIGLTAYDADYAVANDDLNTIVNENQTNGNESWYATATKSNISVSPVLHDFGGVWVGDTPVSQTFTIENTGAIDVEVYDVTLGGQDIMHFDIQNDTCSGQILSSSGTCTLDVLFDPSSGGGKIASINIDYSGSGGPVLEIPISGTGLTEPEIRLSYTVLNFGYRTVNSSTSQYLRIYNDGTESLYISEKSLSGPNADQFSQSSNCSDRNISPGSNCGFSVYFNPTSEGEKTAVLTIESDDPNEPSIDVPLWGSGSAANLYNVAISSTTGGSTDRDGNNPVSPGGSLTITATPESGYYFTGWTGNYVSSANPITVSDIYSNYTIQANFTLITDKTVTVSSSAGGSTDKDGDNIVSFDGSLTITATPESGYILSGWSGDYDNPHMEASPVTISNIVADMTTQAEFILIIEHEVTVTSSAGGNTDKDGVNTVSTGGSLTITATPDQGYDITWHTPDDVGYLSGNSYIIPSVYRNLTIEVSFSPVSLERPALIALYNSTNGDSWTTNTGWKDGTLGALAEDGFSPPGTECDWYGVNCSGSNINNISLRNNNLTGSIPPELGNLTNLTWLYLDQNHLTGPIPSELSNLTNLIGLFLYTNQLTGPIPSWIGTFTNLGWLYLGANPFDPGPIPPEFANLTNLQYLGMWTNNLTGEIPSWLGNFSNLNYLALTDNPFEGPIPESLASLSNLTQLYLQTIQDLGPIPAWILNKTDWETLVLYDSGFTGPIPEEIRDFTNIKRLELRTNEFSGGIPAWLSELTTLERLRLDSNQLTGGIPPELGDLTNLTELNLSYNQLSGSIPVELYQLTKIQKVYLNNNTLTGELPVGSNALPFLEELRLENNKLTGPIPPEIGNLTTLTTLYLGNNPFDPGPIPRDFANLVNLRNLGLWTANRTGPIPSWLGGLSNLIYLSLSGNQFEGPIPEALDSLANLRQFWVTTHQPPGPIPPWILNRTNWTILGLTRNNFSGPIPDAIRNMTDLTILSLDSNHFSGEIPSWLGELTNLTEIRLEYNALTGSIPPELGNLANLKQLKLRANRLSGIIPPQLGNLTNLEGLWLRRNQLTGEIPGDLANLANLTIFNAHTNQLSGAIPTWFASLPNLNQLYLNDNQFTGPVPAEIIGMTHLIGLGLTLDTPGPIPAWVWDFTNLEYLFLTNSQLTGPIPTEIGNLSKLRQLWLEGNQFTGEIPAFLGNLTDLTFLSLDHNQLTGQIPAALGNLTNLESLFLTYNQLTGSIPVELQNLTRLNLLSLAVNQLTGEIPAWLGDLFNLYGVWLDWNLFSGPLPSAISNLNRLIYFEIGNNQLTGEIPGWIGGLNRLEVLGLESNSFTGTIPSELSNITNLVHLNLSNNSLSGSIPAELGNLTNLSGLFLNSNMLSGDPFPLVGMSELGTIPEELMDVEDDYIDTLTFELDIGYNALDTDDQSAIDFLNSKQIGGDWQSTQTVAPGNLWAGLISDTSVQLNWTPISYTDEPGHYEIYINGLPDPLVPDLTTADKTISSLTVSGLDPTTPYTFHVRAKTDSHADNQNTVFGEFGTPVSATTRVAHTITATAGADGSIDLVGGVTVAEGGSVTFTITPEANFVIADVLVDGRSVGAVELYTFNQVTGDHSIEAVFSRQVFTITATAGAGSIEPSGMIQAQYGANQTFAATPETGHHLVELLVDGVSMGEQASYTFSNVTADHIIHAVFAVNTYTIKAITGDGGSITPAGDTVVRYGEAMTYAINPNPGYRTKDVLVNGGSVGRTGSYSFSNVQANSAIRAEFEVDTHSADYSPADLKINLSELLRLIQFYNFVDYHYDAAGEDGYAPGVE